MRPVAPNNAPITPAVQLNYLQTELNVLQMWRASGSAFSRRQDENNRRRPGVWKLPTLQSAGPAADGYKRAVSKLT